MLTFYQLNPCKLKWNLKQNTTIFIWENVFENVTCKMAAILSQPQCACDNKWMIAKAARLYSFSTTFMSVFCADSLISNERDVFLFLFLLYHDIHSCISGNRPHPASKVNPFEAADPRLKYVCKKRDPRIHFALVCGAKVSSMGNGVWNAKCTNSLHS